MYCRPFFFIYKPKISKLVSDSKNISILPYKYISYSILRFFFDSQQNVNKKVGNLIQLMSLLFSSFQNLHLRTSSICTVVLSYDSLPKIQCNSNFGLLQICQPIIVQVNQNSFVHKVVRILKKRAQEMSRSCKVLRTFEFLRVFVAAEKIQEFKSC